MCSANRPETVRHLGDAVNKAQKLVKMLDLMARVGGVSASDLMTRFDLDARTLRRYLADLRDLDLPILDEGRGDDRIVSIAASWRRTGVQLTLGEVLALHFGRKLFTFLEGTAFTSGHDGAIERLEPAISRQHANVIRQLDSRFLAVTEPAKDYRGAAAELLEELVDALVHDNIVEGRYRKASGVERHYVLHPYTLATFRQGLYLFAYDVEAAQVKTFAVERFVDLLRRRREKFEMPHGWRPEAHVAHAFGIIGGPPERVAIAFEPSMASYLKERVWHPSQTFRTLPDGRLELRMVVATTVELESWILGFGPDAQVLEPASLVERIADLLKRAAHRYTGGG